MMFMGTEAAGWSLARREDAKFDWGLLNMIAEKGVDNGALYAKQGMAHVKAANEVGVKHKALTMGDYKQAHPTITSILACESTTRAMRRGEGAAHRRRQRRRRAVGRAGHVRRRHRRTVGELRGFEEVYNSQSAEFGGWENSGNKQRGVIQQDNDQLMICI